MSNLIDLTKKAGIALEKRKLTGVKSEIVLQIPLANLHQTLSKIRQSERLSQQLALNILNNKKQPKRDFFGSAAF